MERGNPYISVVIPTLNEARNIGGMLSKVKDVLRGLSYELIVVDGHSRDGTVAIARRSGARIIYDSLGKGSALLLGMRAARGNIIIAMDADMSNKPKELKLLIAGIEAGYDVCMGSRFLVGGGSDDMPPVRRFGNKVFVTLVNLMYGSHYTDLCYGYRSFSRAAVRRLRLSEKGFGIETEMSIKAKKLGLRILEVPSYEKKRAAGEGKLSSLSDGVRILRTIFANI